MIMKKRVWIQGEGPGVNDFDETVCLFFDDVEGILKNPRKYGLTENQREILKRFRDEFEEFADNNDFPEEFIATPW